ncbi:MAG: tetratricopeptide repeat protein [Methylophilaceae bacterium]
MKKIFLTLLGLLLSVPVFAACPAAGFEGAVCRGHTLSTENKPAEALTSYIEAEELAIEPFEKMLAITFQARANKAAGNMDQAITLFQQGFEAAKIANSAQGQWINLNEGAELLLAKNETTKALEAFKQGYGFAANANERAESNRLIASAYKQLGDYDHAIEYQLKCSVLERSNGDLNHYLLATLELAELRTGAKNYVQAQKNLDEVLHQAKAANSDYWLAKTMLYQARLEKSQGRASLAQTLLQQAFALAQKVGDANLSHDIAADQN